VSLSLLSLVWPYSRLPWCLSLSGEMLTCHERYKIALFCGLSPPLDKSRTVVTVRDISPHRSDFKDYTPCKGSVRLGDKSTIDQVGIGSIVFTTSLGTPITLSNVLHGSCLPACWHRKVLKYPSPSLHLKSL
jgi:hypothetical protein